MAKQLKKTPYEDKWGNIDAPTGTSARIAMVCFERLLNELPNSRIGNLIGEINELECFLAPLTRKEDAA